MDDLLNVLSVINTITGLSVGAILWGLVAKFFRPCYYRWKYRKVKVNNSYILIVGLKKNVASMKSKILSQRENSLSNLKGLPIEIIELPDDCTAATPTDIIAELKGLRDNMADAQKFNVHLFYAGPVVLTAFIGGFFYNKDRVYIYHQNFASKEYECWGPIQLP